jgi:uncharacterized protein
MTVTSTARVMTERGERYRKQLASHFGHRIKATQTPASTMAWGFGGTTTLTMEPDADNSETRIEDVTGRDLERFGEKDGLVVTWE